MITLITIKALHSLWRKAKKKKEEQIRRVALLRNRLRNMKENRESIYMRFKRERKLKLRKTYFHRKTKND